MNIPIFHLFVYIISIFQANISIVSPNIIELRAISRAMKENMMNLPAKYIWMQVSHVIESSGVQLSLLVSKWFICLFADVLPVEVFYLLAHASIYISHAFTR